MGKFTCFRAIKALMELEHKECVQTVIEASVKKGVIVSDVKVDEIIFDFES